MVPVSIKVYSHPVSIHKIQTIAKMSVFFPKLAPHSQTPLLS